MANAETNRSRRRFLHGTAGLLAALPLTAAAVSAQAEDGSKKKNRKQKKKQKKESKATESQPNHTIRAISSANGLMATQKAYQMMSEGADTLDAVIAGVNLVEDDPDELSVGLGGLPNEQGIVELDAACMHGPTHRAGAVASLRNIRNPSQVARLVLKETDHVLLVGEGALRFARAQGFSEENLLTERSRKIWLYWKQSLSDEDDWLTTPEEELDPAVARFFKRPTGTIHCGGINAAGEMSCVTTTSGLFFKLPGRVGDSPIIGAGLYVDNAIGSCGSTGRGEANLKNLCCFAAVELMRQGHSPEEAGLEVLRRVADHTEERLLDKRGRPTFNLHFYLLANDGTYAGVSMWGPTQFSVTDDQGTRHEACKSLYQRKK
jgi:N4-(beta-N-acetylglucosaminyl)-L-asparaginase